MSKTIVEVNTKQLDARLRRVIRRYRLEMFREMGATLDKIRKVAAEKYIIPASVDMYKAKISLRQLYRIQPSDPHRLTSRTGILKKILLEDTKDPGRGEWNYREVNYTYKGFQHTAAKTGTSETSALKSTVKVVEGLGTASEIYEGSIKTNIRAVPKTKKSQWAENNWMHKSRMGLVSKETPKTVEMRFKHETGIRGKKRPFLRPAYDDVGSEFRSIIRRKLNEIGRS